MGAYAVLNFADHLRLTHAILCSPQFSLDPAKVPFETRWQVDRAAITFRHDRVDETGPVRGIVLYDPFEPGDPDHVALIRRRHPLSPIPLPFGGHSTLEYLAASGCIQEMINGLLVGSMTQTGAIDMRRRTRKENPIYWCNRSVALAKRNHILDALAAAEVASRIDQHQSVVIRCQLAEMQYAAGIVHSALASWRASLADPAFRMPTEYLVRQAATRWKWPSLLYELDLPP